MELPERKTLRICNENLCKVQTLNWKSCQGCKKPMCRLHIRFFNQMVYDFNNNHRVKGYFCTSCYVNRLY